MGLDGTKVEKGSDQRSRSAESRNWTTARLRDSNGTGSSVRSPGRFGSEI